MRFSSVCGFHPREHSRRHRHCRRPNDSLRVCCELFTSGKGTFVTYGSVGADRDPTGGTGRSADEVAVPAPRQSEGCHRPPPGGGAYLNGPSHFRKAPALVQHPDQTDEAPPYAASDVGRTRVSALRRSRGTDHQFGTPGIDMHDVDRRRSQHRHDGAVPAAL